MPYQTADDERVHITAPEKEALGQKVLDLILSEIAGDLGGPACQECAISVIQHAWGLLAIKALDKAAPTEPHELMGMSQRAFEFMDHFMKPTARKMGERGLQEVFSEAALADALGEIFADIERKRA